MKKILLVLVLLLTPTMANPNGSPINTGEIRRTGNIQMIQKKDSRLEDERLSVRIVGDYAFVQVIYRLRNSGPADKVTYGFPVESDRAFDSDYKPIEKSTFTDFRISEGLDSQAPGRVIPVEDVVTDKTGEPPGEDMKPFTSWHIVTIPFKNGMLTANQVQNRRLLRKVMTEAGLIPISSEWWHFDAFPTDEVRKRFKIIE